MKKLFCIGDWQLLEDKDRAIIYHDCERSVLQSGSQSVWPWVWPSASQSASAWPSASPWASRQKKCYYCEGPVPDEVLALYILYNDLV